MTVIGAPIVDFLLVVVFVKIDVAGVGRRNNVGFANVIHVFLQRSLYFVVLALALPVLLARRHHLGVLWIALLRLVMVLREAALRAAAVVVPVRWAPTLVTTTVQAFFARLLRQVLPLVLREALVWLLRATSHVAEGRGGGHVRATLVVPCILLHTIH